MCNKITSNSYGTITSLGDIPPTTPKIETKETPETIDKSEKIIDQEITQDIADFNFNQEVISSFSPNNFSFDIKSSLEKLNSFIDNHKNLNSDNNNYVKGLSTSKEGIDLLKNKDSVDRYLKDKLGINLKDFLILTYKIDCLENKDLSNALKEKLKYGINNSSGSILSELKSDFSLTNEKVSSKIPNKIYSKQDEIENIKAEIKSNKEKESENSNLSYIDKTLDFISDNEKHIPYGSKFEIGLEATINPLKLAEVGINSGIKVEYGFGKGPSYLAHINFDAKISSQLGSFSSTMGDYGLAFYDIDGIKTFKNKIYEIATDNVFSLDDKKNKLLELIKDNSCVLNTQIFELKTLDDSGIKITNTKGFFKPPQTPDEKNKNDSHYKEELSVNDFEIESTLKNGKFKIQSSDLFSVEKDNLDKPPIIKLSFEYSKDFSKININELKSGIKNLSGAIKSSNIDSKTDILNILDNTLKLLNRDNKFLDELNKSLSANTSIELNSDKQGIFLNVTSNSEFLKKFEIIKSEIKNLPISVTPSINFNIGYRENLLDIKK